jgi:hypothetical protein
VDYWGIGATGAIDVAGIAGVAGAVDIAGGAGATGVTMPAGWQGVAEGSPSRF